MEPISVIGEVTISFDIPLTYRDDFNYTMVDKKVLKLSMVPGAESDLEMLNFNWTCIGLSRT